MDDPLSLPFDLLVCGTGCVESIVAASAAYRGLRVLHVDGNPFYGDWDATLPLPQLCEVLQGGGGLCGSQLCLQGGPLPPLPASLPPSLARSLLVDLRPRLVLAQGLATALLVECDAARYLTFRRLGSCHVAQGGGQPALRVPANKGDVFLNPGLTLLEKRGVMRFLQAANDGVSLSSLGAGEEEEQKEGQQEGQQQQQQQAEQGSAALSTVQWVNEAVLGTGRSLLRPQNKSVSSLNEAAYAQRSLEDLLRQGAALSPRTAQCVLSAMALHSSSSSSSSSSGGGQQHPPLTLTGAVGMARVRAYLAALARYGGAAFLAHEYGCGAMSEAFCRLAAVHGGLYMLGCQPSGWERQEGMVRVTLATGDQPLVVQARRALVAAAYAPAAAAGGGSSAAAAAAAATVVCLCIVKEGSSSPQPPTPAASRHTVVPSAPPQQPYTVYVLEQGCEDKVAPAGYRVLYFYCSVAGGEAGRAAAALLAEANSGAWFQQGSAAGEEGGEGAEAEAEAAAAAGGGRRLLWQVCYSVAAAESSSTADTGTGIDAATSLDGLVYTTPTTAPVSNSNPWSGCCVHSEEFVTLAEAAHAQLFPLQPKLFKKAPAVSSSVSSSSSSEAAPTESSLSDAGTVSAAASAAAEGGLPVAAEAAAAPEVQAAAAQGSAAPLSDIEEALALLQQSPLDL